jgi:AcrR family transcriptional regulator
MQLRSEETRREILEAARQQFALAGYDATGVAEICTAAGVSKGAFYHHFQSKQRVFLVLLEEWLEGLEKALDHVLAIPGSAPERLLNMAKLVRIVFEAADGRLPMFLEFWRQASKDKIVWQATIAPYHRFERIFTQLVEDGIQEGSLKPVDAPATARTLVALAVGMVLQGILDPNSTHWDQTTEAGIRYLIEGIARRKP